MNLTYEDVEKLIFSSLAINDKLKIRTDHVEFTGSMNDAEDFNELINRLWHKHVGWVK